MSERNSRPVSGATSVQPWPDLENRLEDFRDLHGGKALAALNQDPPDYSTVKIHEPLAALAGQALITIQKLAEQNRHLTEGMKGKFFVALAEAKEPPWFATHRHYKGKLYRVTGRRMNAEHDELEPMIEYDDRDGTKFVIPQRKWESLLSSGRPRYEYVYSSDMARREE